MATQLARLFIFGVLCALAMSKPTPDNNAPHVQPAVIAVSPPKTMDMEENMTANPLTLPAKPGMVGTSHVGSAIDLHEVHSVQDSASDAPVTLPKVMKPTGQCPRFYMPVCGSDGTTYNTECELDAAAKADNSLHMVRSGAC